MLSVLQVLFHIPTSKKFLADIDHEKIICPCVGDTELCQSVTCTVKLTYENTRRGTVTTAATYYNPKQMRDKLQAIQGNQYKTYTDVR